MNTRYTYVLNYFKQYSNNIFTCVNIASYNGHVYWQYSILQLKGPDQDGVT